MKILVLSDTHISGVKVRLPQEVEKELTTCQLCLHAGDFVEYSVFEKLSSLINTYGVCGNMDSEEVRKRLPLKQIIPVENVNIGLIHGRGAPNNLISYVKKEFSQHWAKIDIFIFGHSHFPLDKVVEGKIYFNPGSPTDKVFAPYNSYGIIEIKEGVIKRRIVRIG